MGAVSYVGYPFARMKECPAHGQFYAPVLMSRCPQCFFSKLLSEMNGASLTSRGLTDEQRMDREWAL